ncbi:MAG: hypothetical protein JWR08_2501 [Enterovirga sp.]|jgi:hypothetical protein|nr:hypothetical protein [Enterovirga sp.]
MGSCMAGSAKRDGKSPIAAGETGTKKEAVNGGAPEGPALDRVIQAQIGDKLRAMYTELVEQPVPDRLAAILSQLGESGGSKG